MFGYILNRLAISIPTIFVIIVLSFFIIKLAPGGPFDDDAEVPDEVRANLEAAYNLDRPVIVQLGLYMGGLLKGDLGPSFVFRDQNVADIIRTGFPVSAKVGLSAIFLGAIIGMFVGLIAALRKNSALDYTIMTVAMTGIAVPTFVTAPFLALIFGLYLSLLPIAGWGDGQIRNMVLPVVALALPKIGTIARVTRGAILDVMRAAHVRTARAKGLPEHLVIRRHILRAGMLPVVSYLGPSIAGVMTGSVIIETIFALPGIGRAFVEASLNRDYPVVMGITIVYAIIIISMNLLVDILYRFLDPRIREG
ncbi:MAG: ABC transporter permease subunit [Gammaproteobacteria bacterium]|nr:ABC transporter permease subunit [Gammaproteobacteria bacterium]